MVQKLKRVFIWNDYKQWRHAVLRLVSDVFDKSVLEEIQKNPPRYLVFDQLQWLDKIIQRSKGIPSSDIAGTLISRFLASYEYVRGYHGCRIVSVETYQHEGILPSNPADLDKLAYEIFQHKDGIEGAIKELAAKSSNYRELNRGKIFFCLQQEQLIQGCGHYLLFGSEYLQCIAVRIGEMRTLRERGRATVIECNVPTSELPHDYLRGLIGVILEKIVTEYLGQPATREFINFGFYISNKLQPVNIVGIHYPTGIRNPDTGLRED